MAAKKKKKPSPRTLEIEAKRLETWAAQLEDRERVDKENDEKRRQRIVVELEDKQKQADELAARQRKVAQSERDAEVGKALRVVGRALLEGAFFDGDGDERRQWPSSLARMLFGPSPYGRGW